MLKCSERAGDTAFITRWVQNYFSSSESIAVDDERTPDILRPALVDYS